MKISPLSAQTFAQLRVLPENVILICDSSCRDVGKIQGDVLRKESYRLTGFLLNLATGFKVFDLNLISRGSRNILSDCR